MSLWMNLEQLVIEPTPARAPGLLARLARLFRAADDRQRSTAVSDATPAVYDGPERRSGNDRRTTPRSGPDRRR